MTREYEVFTTSATGPITYQAASAAEARTMAERDGLTVRHVSVSHGVMAGPR